MGRWSFNTTVASTVSGFPRVCSSDMTSVVLPLDSEIVAPVSVRSPSGIRPGCVP